MPAEKNFENKIKKYLKEQGCWFIKYWAGAAFTKEGIPDILACVNGYFVAIEVKASKGKPSDLQLYNLKRIDEAGGFAILLYPKDFEQFKDFIRLVNRDDFSIYNIYRDLKGRWLNASKS